MTSEESPNSLKRYNSAPQINDLVLPNNKSTMSSATPNSSREPTPVSFSNIFTPRARRFSASFSPLALSPNPRLTTKSQTSYPSPRISQLRQEECTENLREVNHEREIHSQLQMSQSYEDLTLVAENWSFKNNFDDISNPMNSTLPGFSPSSRTTNLRLPYLHMSPSPTRKTFATRRSMSPTMRPSTLGGVKRKFELDDNGFNTNSPPPFKRMFMDRGPSPSICPSPSPSESSHEGDRATPKLFASKIFANANTNSLSSLSSETGSFAGNDSETPCLLMEIANSNPILPSINTPLMPMETGTIMEEPENIVGSEEIEKLDAKKFESLQEQSVANITDNDKLKA